MSAPRKRRLARAAHGVAATAGTALVFVGALLLGVKVHLDHPATRQLVITRVNAALEPLFEGKLVIDRIGHLGLTGLEGASARVLAPDGSDVVRAEGLRARVDLLDLARSALFGGGDIEVRIDEASLDHADVSIDGDGVPLATKIQRAFALRDKTPSRPGKRGVVVAIAHIGISHAWVHGRLGSAPAIDADVEQLRGSLLVAHGETHVDVDGARIRTRALPRGLDADGEANVHLSLPSKGGHPLGLEGAFGGTLGGIALTARGALDGEHLDASADVPRVAAEKVRALFPEAPVREEVSAHVEARGDLPRLETQATVTLGAATLKASGPITLGEEPRAELALDARAVDLRALSAGAPESALAATANVSLVLPSDGRARGDFTIDVLPGTLAAQSIPRASLRGTFTKETSGLTARAQGTVHETGAPTAVTVALRPDGSSFAIDAHGRASVRRLDGVPRLGPIARGSADVQWSGTVRLGKQTVDASVDADLRDVEQGGAHLAHGRLTARVSGKLASPAVRTTLTAERIESGRFAFSHAVITTEGSTGLQHVEATLEGDDTPDVHATAEVDLGKTTSIRDVVVTMKRSSVAVTARARRVHLGKNALTVEGAEVEGLGARARASLDMTSETTVIRARSRGIALSRVASLLGMEGKLTAGWVDFDVDLVLGKQGVTGRIKADVSHASVLSTHDASAHFEAIAEGHRWNARGRALLGDVGYAELATTDLQLGAGSVLEAPAWKRAWGRVDVDGRIDLARLVALLPPKTLPVEDARGIAEIHASLARSAESDNTPDVTLAAKTEGLSITLAHGAAISGIDVALDAKVDGTSGNAEATARLRDHVGELVKLEASSDAIPYGELLASRDLLLRAETVPFLAKLTLPPRALDKLPAGYAIADVRGEISAVADFRGTLLDPDLQITASAKGIGASDAPTGVLVDSEVTARYDGEEGIAQLSVRSRKAELLRGSAHLELAAKDALARPPLSDLPWSGSAEMQLMSFPLQRVAFLSDRDVRGKISGSLTLDDLHTAPRASGQLEVDGLQVGDVTYASAKLTATIDEHALRATARIERPDGFAEGRAVLGMSWGRALVPSLDPSQPLDVTLLARKLRAAALLPFFDTVLSELDGTLDADAHLAFDPKAGGAKASGTLVFSDGLVQIASLGTELHAVNGKVTLSPDGTVRIDNVTARGVSGSLSGQGVAHLRGLHFADATAQLQIPRGQAIPLDVRGTQLGSVDGSLSLRAESSPDGATTNVAIEIPSLHVELPLASAHAAKDRPELPNVHVGVRAPEAWKALPLDEEDVKGERTQASTGEITLAVHLGQDVEIKRGTSLKVAVEGRPTVRLKGDTEITGQLLLKSGTLQVQGKKFEIESGTVSFVNADPMNPLVVVTAGWTAADGTRVFADFKGPLKSGKVTLRSEPSRPKDEILALILFGSADQSSYSGGQSDEATRAGSAAGALATAGLAEGLAELTGIEIVPTIDTSNAANPKPEVAIPLARNVSVQFGYVLGTPPPGVNPDKSFATIDWRFATRWSLETTFGDHGTSFADLVWQYRY